MVVFNNSLFDLSQNYFSVNQDCFIILLVLHLSRHLSQAHHSPSMSKLPSNNNNYYTYTDPGDIEVDSLEMTEQNVTQPR